LSYCVVIVVVVAIVKHANI